MPIRAPVRNQNPALSSPIDQQDIVDAGDLTAALASDLKLLSSVSWR
jgi:hypothetical protein